ncbi:glycosyltransferase family 2 protein [Roseimaritima ulvae]|uniref:Galactosyltransferase C-terminal domain-containing protein n=1 Tax=Roseimaritima ulvae TaxID=980254 RepID=A0A5B9QJE8_9BACT|nr:glycosyltransferase family 2 protein [Roseimaritima ulvae]QEG39247.1 hypothetical protein UC8_12080 [Roseimaritima ulvae]
MSLSVLTIVRGRQQHLDNLLTGLLRSNQPPVEWIVVGMDQDVQLAKRGDIKLRTSRIDGDGSRLPLAEARNHAAELCQTDRMVFLDVDCIPSTAMIDVFDAALADQPQLWMGNPRYLPAGATDPAWTLESLQSVAARHPLQPNLVSGERRTSDRYELFWSLCFGITRSDFEAIGGFDESFRGYGGEDTDFAFSARQAGIQFGFVGATVFHQHHAVCKPPLNHFREIVRNAEQFRLKWREWPMASWLQAFDSMGLVRFDDALDRLRVLREPTATEIEEATSLAPAGF